MHLKRQEVPKEWPIARKGSVYVVRPNSKLKSGIPILIVLRDMLKIALNRKEVKSAIHQKNIFINGKPVKDEKHAVSLFDVITIVPSKKNYRIEISEKRKFEVREISEKESYKKILKVINKKTLKNKKIQINFSDGTNFVSDIECRINDSVLINLKEKRAEKCLPLREKSKVIIFDGKHMGETGIAEKIDSEHKMVELNVNGKKVSVLIKQIMVIE